MTKLNIVLIGFMGSGKSTIGNKLAEKISYTFIDSDQYLEELENKTISHIFDEFGEEYFRNVEKNVINKLSKLDKHVLATGGGVIKNIDNINLLKTNGVVVYLKSSPEKIYNNIKNDTKRPLLNTDEPNKLKVITKLLNERDPLYCKYADLIIDIKDTSIDASANLIINTLATNNFL